MHHYKPLNAVVMRERHPLPLIEDLVDQLVKVRIYTTLDLKNGFFHLAIEEGSRKYTSFVTLEGQWEVCKVPFGLCNSPPVFQRYVQYIFRDLIRLKLMLIYITRHLHDLH